MNRRGDSCRQQKVPSGLLRPNLDIKQLCTSAEQRTTFSAHHKRLKDQRPNEDTAHAHRLSSLSCLTEEQRHLADRRRYNWRSKGCLWRHKSLIDPQRENSGDAAAQDKIKIYIYIIIRRYVYIQLVKVNKLYKTHFETFYYYLRVEFLLQSVLHWNATFDPGFQVKRTLLKLDANFSVGSSRCFLYG